MNAVTFVLPDGSTVEVGDKDMRAVYEALWDLSHLPGAISTAAVLLHEGRQSARFFHPVELNAAQGEALRTALARFANPS
jgi:sensor domain CHASE-containing protein